MGLHLPNGQHPPVSPRAPFVSLGGKGINFGVVRWGEETEGAKALGEPCRKIICAGANYLLFEENDRYGIIRHATVDLPRKSGVDESAMYGDYYFAEALYRRINKDSTKATSLLY